MSRRITRSQKRKLEAIERGEDPNETEEGKADTLPPKQAPKRQRVKRTQDAVSSVATKAIERTKTALHDLKEYRRPYMHEFNNPERPAGATDAPAGNEDGSELFDMLPLELVDQIASYLHPINVHNAMRTNKLMMEIFGDQGLWKRMALQRFGDLINTRSEDNWRTYLLHRCSSKRAPGSPLCLKQEWMGEDPWMLLVSCLLMSRTSGGEVVRQCIHTFLQQYPTPTAACEGSPSDMCALIHPLGMQNERIRFVQLTSRAFLDDWESVVEFNGCGAFADDSFRVFCHSQFTPKLVSNATVKMYAKWASGLPLHEEDEYEEEEEEEDDDDDDDGSDYEG